MLFEIYWCGVHYSKAKLAPIIKEAPPEDSFVIITTYYQDSQVTEWIAKENIPVQYRMEEPITNILHKDNGRSLRLYILGNGPKLTPSVYKERVKLDTVKTVLIAPEQIELAI